MQLQSPSTTRPSIPDISDLLPALHDACSRTRSSGDDKGALRSALAEVRDRCGQEVVTKHAQRVYGDACEWHNATIDLLDRDYPDWRGYVPPYLQQRLSA